MKLNQLEKGQSAIVVIVEASKELKNRFNSFGLVKGVQIYIEGHSLAKKTLEVRINNTRIALRASEAEKIEIKPILDTMDKPSPQETTNLESNAYD